MIYYIDGYNLFFQDDSIDLDEFKINRQKALENFYNQVKGFSHPIIIVFDAYRQSGEFSRVHYKDIEVVYSAYKQKADEYIIEAVQRASLPHDIVVITNDKALSREVKELKGRVQSTDQFLLSLKKKPMNVSEKSNSKDFTQTDFEYYQDSFSRRFKKRKE